MSSGARPVRAPKGTELSCRGWQQEAVLRMLMNNLDPEGLGNEYCIVCRTGIDQNDLEVRVVLLHQTMKQTADVLSLVVGSDDDRAFGRYLRGSLAWCFHPVAFYINCLRIG